MGKILNNAIQLRMITINSIEIFMNIQFNEWAHEITRNFDVYDEMVYKTEGNFADHSLRNSI